MQQALSSGKCPQGLKINFDSSELSNKGVYALAKALSSGNCPTGLALNLWLDNDKKLKSIAKALSSGNCPQGLILILYENGIVNGGIETLAQALVSGNCPPGLMLSLYSSSINAQGIKTLAQALSSGNCPPGLKIGFAYTDIGDEGIKILAKALPSNKCTLRALDLRSPWGGIINPNTFTFLMRHLRYNYSITELQLSNLNPEQEELLNSILKRNKQSVSPFFKEFIGKNIDVESPQMQTIGFNYREN